MKKIFFGIFNLVGLIVYSQNAEEIIQKYAAAMGGLDAFTKTNSAKISGTIQTSQGNSWPLTIQLLNGKAMRREQQINDQAILDYYYNGKGWKVNPLTGSSTPVDATPGELVMFRNLAHLASPLMDYKSRGHLVELQGQEDLNGVKAFKIKLTNKENNRVTTYFINSSDYKLIKTSSFNDLAGQELETFYTDSRIINGISFFFHLSYRVGGNEVQSFTVEKIELNVPVDEGIFKM